MKLKTIVKTLMMVFAFTSVFIFNGCGTQEKTLWEKQGLKGKVKEYTERDYNVTQKFGKDVKTLSSQCQYKYDDKGNKIEEAFEEYNETGNLTSKFKYEYKYKYDTNTNQIEQLEYEAGKLLTQVKGYF